MHKGRGEWQGRTSTSDPSHAAIPIRRFDGVKMRENARVQENCHFARSHHGRSDVAVLFAATRLLQCHTRLGCEGVPVVDCMQLATSKGANDHLDRGQGSSVAVLAVSCCCSEKVAFGQQ